LVGALVAVLVAGGLGARVIGARQQFVYHERSSLAMGTFVAMRAAGPRAPAALDEAMAEIHRLDRLFDYGGAESDVGRLNLAAGGGPIAVQQETIVVLERALDYARASGGAFDPTVGPLVDVWGFRPDTERRVPDNASIASALALVDYRLVRIDKASGTAELTRAGMRVDLGGIAKGYAADRAADVLVRAGITSAILDIGGNVYVLGLRDGAHRWRVGLQHPRQTDAMFGVLSLTGHSVATSGDYQRFFEADGERYHHVLDPRTGQPARGLIAASIVAETGLDADAASTAVFVLGLEPGLQLLESMGLEAVLFTEELRIVVTEGLRPHYQEVPR
jgi:thiamine biosynthesis lipoprotein